MQIPNIPEKNISLIFLLMRENNSKPPNGTNIAPRVPDINMAYVLDNATKK